MSGEDLIDLEGEFASARKALPNFADRIRPRVSEAIWNARAPVLGVLAVEYDRAGGWEPFAHADHVSGGVLSLIVACRADDDDDEEITHPVPRWIALQGPTLIDLVAVPLGAAHRWARRTGLARTLGRIPYMRPRTVVRVHRAPTSWLAGDGGGVAILERERGDIASIMRACTGALSRMTCSTRANCTR